MKTNRPFPAQSCLGVMLLTLLTIMTASSLKAATNYWSASGSTIGGSTVAGQAWDTIGANWTPDGVTFAAWNNASNDTAAFTSLLSWGTGVNSLTLSNNITLGGFRHEHTQDFGNSPNKAYAYYLLASATSTTNSLDFGNSGATIYINSGTITPYLQVSDLSGPTAGYFIATPTDVALYPGSFIPVAERWQGVALAAPIGGSGTLTKTGPGYVHLQASNNTFTGTLAINEGSVQLGRNIGVQNYDALLNFTNITMADGTRLGAWSTNVNIKPPITLSSGTVTISGNITPINNPNQGVLYKKLTISGGIRGTGNVVFKGVNVFNQYNQTILATNCTYTGNTLLTCGNFDLHGMRGQAADGGGTANWFSQQNMNAQYGLQLGIDNALPPATVLTMDGEMAITAIVSATSSFLLYDPANPYTKWRQFRVLDFYLNGFNQTLAGLNNTNRFNRLQRIVNLNANAASTLTISNTADCTFAGSIGNVVLPGDTAAEQPSMGLVKSTNHLDGNNLALVKAGPGTLTLMGPPLYTNIYDFSAFIPGFGNAYANGTVINGGTLVAANSLITWTNTYAGTVINNSSATGPGPVNINSGGTLAGTGSIGGVVTNNAGGILSPGIGGIGTLTLNGNVVLQAGSTSTFEVNGSTPANDRVALGGTVTYGGVLNIVPTGSFTVGQTFTLFSGAGATSASQFSSIAGSAGSGKAFSFTNGILTVVTAPSGPSGPGTITNSLSGNTLTLTWPAGQTWRLVGQTNSLSTGLNPATNAWFTVPGGVDGSNSIIINRANPTVFYRLVYP